MEGIKEAEINRIIIFFPVRPSRGVGLLLWSFSSAPLLSISLGFLHFPCSVALLFVKKSAGGTATEPTETRGIVEMSEQEKGVESEERQHKRLFKIIRKLMKKENFDSYYVFAEKDIHKTLWCVRDVLEKEKSLVEIKPPVVVVGDIHGQFQDLCRIFQGLSDKESGVMGYTKHKFVFLGDYVDRGKQSIECIMLLLLLKIVYRYKFMLLRGNHETRAINFNYGFHEEIVERYGKNGHAMWLLFNDIFNHLPVACLINGEILCMHGGISPHLNSLDDIRNIPKPLPEPTQNALALDLMWADPMLGLKGFQPNAMRAVSVHFGEDAAIATCKKIGVRLIIRAHQMMINGFNFFCNRLVLTIFSAPDYFPAKRNRGAFAFIDDNGHVGMHILVPTDRQDGGEKVFRGSFDEGLEEDFGGVHRKKGT